MKSSDSSLDDTAVDVGSSDTVAAGAAGAAHEPATSSRYELGDQIGRGGMGEVIEARDPHIGRSIAFKRMRGAGGDDAVARFLREAKIQARLDHPAIVPVYELGTDRDGHPYFTMKRLAGTTLADVLARGDRKMHELLRAFVDVCRAIDFAHSRGVVHRDLKPSNVMLGDYGEVYVLDWGIARVVGDREGTAGAPGDITTLEGHTQVGALLGTPGYMAPEQVRGEAEVNAAADVYALGCILFEVLAGESVHPRGNAALASTLAPSATLAPRQRRPEREVAPELDTACSDALVDDPAARPSARVLADRVQAYLDGDRDLEHRRALAVEQIARARSAIATGDREKRAEAMQAAGHAIVLDPTSTDAAAIVMSLALEPPRELPAELERELDDLDDDHSFSAARYAAYGHLVFVPFVPVVLWAGVSSVPALAVTFGAVLAVAAFMWLVSYKRIKAILAAFLLNAALVALLGYLINPLVVVPGLAVIFAMGMGTEATSIRIPWLTSTLMVTAWLVPIVLELTGVLSPTFALGRGVVEVSSPMISIDSSRALIVMIVATGVAIGAAAIFSRALSASRRDAQRRVTIQAWHLRKMLPIAAPAPPAPEPRCMM